jgi:hypothetical protein
MSWSGIQNARITGTMLGVEDHGILSAFVHLDYGGTGQGFGGYSLDATPAERSAHSKRRPHAACGLFVARVLEVIGVDTWEELKGKSVRVRTEDGLVVALGHYLLDKWFEPRVELAAIHPVRS